MIVWILGLSGAGKTTIGRALHRQWKEIDPSTVLVDGDEVRRIFAQDRTSADYSLEARRRSGERLFEICRWLDGEGINVVCSALLLFPDLQIRNRNVFTEYFEVYIQVPVEVLIERDDKGIYQPAIEGRMTNVVGVDIEFPTPPAPDLVIDNSAFDTAPDAWGATILREARILGPSANA